MNAPRGGVLNPGYAIKIETDSDNDGIIDQTWVFTYDVNNNLTNYTEDADNDGTTGYHTYTLNSNGLPIKDECDQSGDGTVDYVINYSYDSKGFLTGYEFKLNNSASGGYQYFLWSTISSKAFNPNQVPFLKGFSYQTPYSNIQDNKLNNNHIANWHGPTPSADFSHSYTYANDYFIKEEKDSDNDGTIDNIKTYTYDSNDNLSKEEWDEDNNGTIDRIFTYTYDSNGNRIKYEQQLVGSNISVHTYTYDSSGNFSKEEKDNNNDGVIDEINSLTYDSDGNLSKIEKDTDNDGMVDEVYYYTWSQI